MTSTPARVFVLVSLACVALLVGTFVLTRGRIDAGAPRAQREAIALVLPAALHDNDVLADEISVQAPHWLGSDAPLRAWRATRGGAPSALVLEAVAPDGYAGPIHLLVGVDAQGKVLGVRITQHRETPGLGDAIESRKSAWIHAFTGRSLDDPARARWQVRREGGDFDQFAGATVTPRAVVHAVRRVLEYVAAHGAQLHAATTGDRVEHFDAPEP